MPAKILYIEDNEANRMLIRFILEPQGYQLAEAEDAETCLRMASEQMPDLILMDLQLPGMDGICARRLLKDGAETRDIKVIAVTSFAMEDDREKVMAAGFEDFVSKPVDADELLEAIKKHLRDEDKKLRRGKLNFLTSQLPNFIF